MGAAKSQTLPFFFSPPPTGTPALAIPVLPGEDALPGSRTAFVPACTLGACVYTRHRATSDLCNLSGPPPARVPAPEGDPETAVEQFQPDCPSAELTGREGGRRYPQSARQPGRNEPTAGPCANADANGFLQFRSTVRVPTVLIRTGISNRRASLLLPFRGEEKAPDEGNGPSRGNKGSGVEQWEW